MRLKIPCAIVVAMAALSCAATNADTVIADFAADYQPITPKSGWSYSWIASGSIGNRAAYVPLLWDPNNHFYDVTGSTYPAAGNGAFAEVGAATFGGVPDVHPGRGYFQSTDTNEYYTIEAYTLSSSGETSIEDFVGKSVDINPAGGGVNFFVGVDSGGSVIAVIPDGGTYTAASIPLGFLVAGDTIFVGVGAGSYDFNDASTMEFKIAQAVPLPSARCGGLFLFVGLGLAGVVRRECGADRRKRHCRSL